MSDQVFIGIDPTAGKKPINYAVLDGDLRQRAAGTGTLDEVLGVIGGYPSAVVAVDAPQGPNAGLLGVPDYRVGRGLLPHKTNWAGYRVCEYELRRRGIGLYSTPMDVAAAAPWMRLGFRLYAALAEAGFSLFRPGENADGSGAGPRQSLEVHPHACYTVLLGHLPLPKASLEGRLQRQLVLYREHINVPDPMDALEELTPHRVLAEGFDLPALLDHDSLDALAAAFTAYLAAQHPERVTLVGDEAEGRIALPVAEGELKETYARKAKR